MKYYFYYLYYKTLFYKEYLFGNINYRQLNKKISEINLYIYSSMYPIEIWPTKTTKTTKKIVDIDGEEEESWLGVSDEDCTTACVDTSKRVSTKMIYILIDGCSVSTIEVDTTLTPKEVAETAKKDSLASIALKNKVILREIITPNYIDFILKGASA